MSLISNQPIQYKPEIDGLRALAVLAVIFFHAFPNTISGGYIGVDIFFVISGYLITNILISEISNGSFSIAKFYERRIRRILPALYFVLICCIPFTYILLTPGDIKEFSGSLICVVTFLSNILFYKITNYFNSATELKPLIHTWSLAVEEQFYLIFPILLNFVYKKKRLPMLLVMSSITFTSLAVAAWGGEHNSQASFYLPHSRAWEFLSGAILALYFDPNKHTPHHLISELSTLLGLVLITGSFFYFSADTANPSLLTLFPILGTVLILAFSSKSLWGGSLLRSKCLVGIGLISYSLYLWHQPIFAFFRYFSAPQITVQSFIFLLSMTFFLSFLTWKFVEQPFRKKEIVKRKTLYISISFITLILVSFGILGYKTSGFSQLKMTNAQRNLINLSTFDPPHNACLTQSNSKGCENYLANTTWVTFGDSHSGVLAEPLADKLAKQNINLIMFQNSGCAPVFGRKNKAIRCSEWTEDTVDTISKNDHIKYVVMSYRINYHLFGEHRNVYPGLPNEVDEEEREKRWNSYIKLIKHFVQCKKKVFLVLQAPEMPKRITYLILANEKNLTDINGVPKKWWDQRSSFVMSRLNDIPPEVTVINPENLFCNQQNCKAVLNGTPLYKDYDHLSYMGSQYIADLIIKDWKTSSAH